MLRLKIILRPIKVAEININYRSRLNVLCKELIKFSKRNKFFMLDEEKSREQIYFSPLFCKSYEVNEGKIIFKDDTSWYLTCESYSTILDLIQGFYGKNVVRIGKAEFEVMSIKLSNVGKTTKSKTLKEGPVINKDYEEENSEIAIIQ